MGVQVFSCYPRCIISTNVNVTMKLPVQLAC
jgi:hypothetical protein